MSDKGGGGEKTEKPTPQRLKQARKDGQVARTAELGTWLGAAVASALLPGLVRHAVDTFRQILIQVGTVAQQPEVASVARTLPLALRGALTAVLPLLVGTAAVGFVAGAAQGGVHWSNKPLKPTLGKLNPLPGVKRMFGGHGAWEAAKALIKTSVLAVTLWATASHAKELVSASGAMPLSQVVSSVTGSALLMLRVAAVTGLALAVADYLVVRRQTMKKLKMSLHEIKMEHKQSEGDPHVKAQRRAVQMSMSRRRMTAAVKDADVLLVNPTHVAVALKYEASRGAPRVVAKGAGEVAARLRALAEEHRVPMVQDIPLARALHASCDLGQEVPTQLFTAVARVLAFIYQLRSRGVAAGVHRPGFPAPVTEDLPRAGRRRRPVRDPVG